MSSSSSDVSEDGDKLVEVENEKKKAPKGSKNRQPCGTCYEDKPQNLSDNDDLDRYKRLLDEASASVSQRDVLIELLQQQLKKIEDLYKQNFKETQDVRRKLCKTVQELGNLKQINEKYKEDIQGLLQLQNEKNTAEEEVAKWKLLYEQLLTEFQSKDDILKVTSKVSQESQVNFVEQLDMKNVLDALILHYCNMEDTLKNQQDKLEILVKKMLNELNTQVKKQLFSKNNGELEESDKKQTDNNLPDTQFCCKDSVIQLLKNENLSLKKEISLLKGEAGAKDDEKDMTKDKCCKSSKGTVTVDQLKMELQVLKNQVNELNNENLRLNEIKCCANNQTDALNKEIIQLRQTLKEKEEQVQNLLQNAHCAGDKKNIIIKELSDQNKALKLDYEEVLRHNKQISKELKEKIIALEERDLVPELSDNFQPHCTVLSMENDNLREQLAKKEKLLQKLQLELEELQMLQIDTYEPTKPMFDMQQCNCYIEELEEQLESSKHTIEKLIRDKEKLTLRVNETNKALQQYKEQAEFKKLENDKLRNVESQLQCTVCNMKAKQEDLEKDLKQEVCKSSTKVSQIANKYNTYKMECECIIEKLNTDLRLANETICTQHREIVKMKDENKIFKEDFVQLKQLHNKCVNSNEKAIDEFKMLFKKKEEEVDSIAAELCKCHRRKTELEIENHKLKETCRKRNESTDVIEANFKCMESKYCIEKRKCNDLTETVEALSKELKCLKQRLQGMLTDLVFKITPLKIPQNRCPLSGCTYNDTLDEILVIIKQFYETTYHSPIEPTCCTKTTPETNICPFLNEDFMKMFATKEAQTTSLCISNRPGRSKSLNNLNVESALVKRKFLLDKVDSIHNKLLAFNICPLTNTVIPKRVKSSTCDLCTPIKSNEKAVSCKNALSDSDKEDLLFQYKHYKDELKKLEDQYGFEKSCQHETVCMAVPELQPLCRTPLTPTECIFWNSDVQKAMTDIAAGLLEMKRTIRLAENKTNKCESKHTLEAQIKNLQDQLKCVLSREALSAQPRSRSSVCPRKPPACINIQEPVIPLQKEIGPEKCLNICQKPQEKKTCRVQSAATALQISELVKSNNACVPDTCPRLVATEPSTERLPNTCPFRGKQESFFTALGLPCPAKVPQQTKTDCCAVETCPFGGQQESFFTGALVPQQTANSCVPETCRQLVKRDPQGTEVCPGKQTQLGASAVCPAICAKRGELDLEHKDLFGESQSDLAIKAVVPTFKGLLESVIETTQNVESFSLQSEKELKSTILTDLSQNLSQTLNANNTYGTAGGKNGTGGKTGKKYTGSSGNYTDDSDNVHNYSIENVTPGDKKGKGISSPGKKHSPNSKKRRGSNNYTLSSSPVKRKPCKNCSKSSPNGSNRHLPTFPAYVEKPQKSICCRRQCPASTSRYPPCCYQQRTRDCTPMVNDCSPEKSVCRSRSAKTYHCSPC